MPPLMLMQCLMFFLAFLAIANAFPSIDWVDCQTQIPFVLEDTVASLNLTSLPSTLHCGRLVVPLDYSKPIDAVDNNITLGLAMYRPPDPKGVIFYCPGGTDAGAAVAWQVALGLNSNSMPNFEGLLDYDLMMMDIRGTWSSNNLSVDLSTIPPVIGPYPSNEEEFEAFQAAASTVFQSFANMSSPPGILNHAGTREVIQDYERVRIALGYEKIHFLGASYGSYRNSEYAVTFPERVGHFALDAVVPHGLDIDDQVKYDLVAVNRALLRADAYCQNNATCPFHQQGRGSVPQAWLHILAQAENGTLVACDANANTTCNNTVATWELQAALAGALSDQPDFPNLLEALVSAYAGNAALFLGGGALTVDVTWGIIEICNDNPVVNKSFAHHKHLIDIASSVDIYHINQSESIQTQLICAAWPYAEPVASKPLQLTQKMLLVTADFDINIATEQTTFVWETQAHKSGLVVRHGDDHVSFNEPLVASTNLTKHFLRTGILPCPEDNTYLTVYAPGGQRRPISDPYDVPTGLLAGDIDSS